MRSTRGSEEFSLSLRTGLRDGSGPGSLRGTPERGERGWTNPVLSGTSRPAAATLVTADAPLLPHYDYRPRNEPRGRPQTLLVDSLGIAHREPTRPLADPAATLAERAEAFRRVPTRVKDAVVRDKVAREFESVEAWATSTFARFSASGRSPLSEPRITKRSCALPMGSTALAASEASMPTGFLLSATRRPLYASIGVATPAQVRPPALRGSKLPLAAAFHEPTATAGLLAYSKRTVYTRK